MPLTSFPCEPAHTFVVHYLADPVEEVGVAQVFAAESLLRDVGRESERRGPQEVQRHAHVAVAELGDRLDFLRREPDFGVEPDDDCEGFFDRGLVRLHTSHLQDSRLELWGKNAHKVKLAVYNNSTRRCSSSG